METAFSIVPRNVGSFDYFALHGNIDAQAEKLLKELPHKVQRPVVKFDFSKAGRINSMGIALLLRCLKSIKEEKKSRDSYHSTKPDEYHVVQDDRPVSVGRPGTLTTITPRRRTH